MRAPLFALMLVACGTSETSTPIDAGADAGNDVVTIGDAATKVTLGAPIVVGRGAAGTTQREPSAVFDAQGALWIAYADYATKGVNRAEMVVVRSTDLATFTEVGRYCGHDNCGNPLLATDAAGRVFLTYGALDLAGGGPRYMTLVRVDVLPSNPKAPPLVFSDDPDVHPDRQWIAIAPDDTIYVAWKRGYGSPTGEIRLASSKDHGVSFGKSDLVLGDYGGKRPFFGALAVGPKGELEVAAVVGSLDYTQASAVVVLRSTDGGKSFAAPVALDTHVQQPIPGPLGTLSNAFIDFPTVHIAADGTVLATWPRQRTADPGAVDVVVARSNDGLTFGSPVQVNDDTAPAVHLQPATAIDEGGRMFVSWLDARHYPGGKNPIWEMYFAHSSDRGASFSPNLNLGAPATFGDQGKQEGPEAIGEFNGVAARAGKIAAAWADAHTGDPDVYVVIGSY